MILNKRNQTLLLLYLHLSRVWSIKIHDVYIPQMLFTSISISESLANTMYQLRKKFPKFNNVDRATALWIPVDKKGKF